MPVERSWRIYLAVGFWAFSSQTPRSALSVLNLPVIRYIRDQSIEFVENVVWDRLLDFFPNTLAAGSIAGLLALIYAMNVAIEVMRIQLTDSRQAISAGILHSTLATLFSYASLPVIVWPAVYVWLHDGVLAAVLAWFCLQAIGRIAVVTLRMRSPLLSFHLLLALLALPFGYYSTISTAPWHKQNSAQTSLEYETSEFRSPGSRVPTVMFCSFAGEHTKRDSDATELAIDFFIAMGVPDAKIEAWGRDTIIFASTEMRGVNLEEYWQDSCSVQFSKMKAALR